VLLHADVDAFFASVEQRDDPRLRGRPTIVGSGVVMAASYEARAFGVRGAMGGAQARRLCPQAIFVEPRFGAYVEASGAIFEVFRDTSPVVEGLSLEEAFLDVAGLERISGSPVEIARRLRREVRRRVGLAITVGVARTKVVAKMASRTAKPDGLLVVPPGEELDFLHPLPVEAVWGVGPSTARKLRDLGIATVGEIAATGEAFLASALGPAAGSRLYAVAHNRDYRPVRAGRRRSSYGSQSALASTRSRRALETVLAGLVDRVTRRMRAKGRAGRTVTLRMRFDDFTRASRSRTLPYATAAQRTIHAAAADLLDAAMPTIRRRGLTLVGITVGNLDGRHVGVQLELPLERGWSAALDVAVDEVRERFGSDAITRAALLGRRRLSPSLLADEQKPARSEHDRDLSRAVRSRSLRRWQRSG
jgi:nucleotidyltransferase/DNA polymerase involved in DNA repair